MDKNNKRETAAGLSLEDGQYAGLKDAQVNSKANKDVAEQLYKPSRSQDDYSVRAKSSGHGKKTADKWNQ